VQLAQPAAAVEARARSRCAVQESGPAGAQLREQDSEREGAKEEAGEQDNGSLGKLYKTLIFI